ncbi:antitoxin [Pseudomonas fluorescens]|uniref:type II toxin-antitoxin system RelB family antitoxin n=1 Tax=Pseudomonas fluorescens TaxID=294 RepID=UPI0030DB7FB4
MIDPPLIDPLCPVVPDLDPEEQAASYDRWFRAEVQASLDDPRPSIPHEQVMEEMNALMESMRKSADAD